VPNALRLAALSHAICVGLFALLPWLLPGQSLGWIYGGAVTIVGLLLIYEHALVRPDDLTRVNTAFFNVNVVISVGLFVVGTIDLLWR
jgi:4-hydroxybenzoate polyprenyltransferase